MPTIERGGRRGGSMIGAAIVIAAVAALAVPASRSGASVPRSAQTKEAKGGPRVIIDTDLSRWWDDASTIGLANVLHRRGKMRILGIVSDVPNTVAVAAIDAINTAYGHGDLPLGAVAGSDADTFQHGYTDELVRRLPNSVRDHQDVPSAVALYCRLLARQRDRSVTIVSVGGYTNLAGLLASKRGQGSSLDGRALVADKVKRLVQMDGIFPGGGPAFTNQKIDLESASAVVGGEGWPTPIAWVDGLGGVQTMVGGSLCTTAPPKHPMRIVYEVLFACGPPKDGNWDAPTLLYAIGDLQGVFSEEGHGGAAVINAQGGLSWETSSSRPSDVYVHVIDQPTLNQRIDELLAAA
jgi:Inosine-uridine preferring nucleoside hydrolase